MGHLVDSDGKAYIGPSQQLDVEMEFAFFLGKGIERYQRVSIAEAEDHIFGVVLLNDWSSIAHRSPRMWYMELTRVSTSSGCAGI
jgi:fumarylacetoacetase